MIPNQDRSILVKALDKWGEKAQCDQAIEEAAELIVALRHHDRERPGDLLGEIADMGIMLDQLRILFGEDGCQKARDLKMERLEIRLNDDEH